ncbi:MAG: dolichyl-phosphate beta-glucosyltransferase [Terriglobales bacterium]
MVARHFLPGSLPLVAQWAGFDFGQGKPAGAQDLSKLPQQETAELSIVIPAYNEAGRLSATLAAIAEHFRGSGRRVEVLVVDDGSTDGTAERAHPPADAPPQLTWRLLRNPGNRGKGYSVRHGMLAATGERLLFTDADLSAPIAELARLEAALDAGQGVEIAIGSRRRRELISTHQSWFRENSGRIFNRIVRLVLGLPYADTQCGFKLFTHASARAIFSRQRIEGWGFDPELLYLARKLGFRVAEVPVVWGHAENTKIRMLRDSWRMFADVAAIRGNAWLGRYRTAARTESAPGMERHQDA